VRRWNFAFQKGLAKAIGQATGRIGGQHAEQCPPGGDPGERSLQYAHRQAALVKLPHREGDQRSVGFKIGAQQDAAGLDSGDSQSSLEEARRQVQHGERLAHKWQHRRQSREAAGVRRDREVTRPSSRCRPNVG
jgi:hypothetical protein